MIIRRVEPGSAAKVGGTLYALLGLLVGLLFSLASLAGLGAGLAGSPFAMIFGIGAIIIMPILYGCFGFIVLFISAALYNLAAKWAGGLVIQAE
ncbi:MAG TPA: hypothetical protein VGP61_02035 [Gemmatimonadales bacterium]|jgi:hypothetical protein|nr:hypothetical protein [Gemmatimonadales bacterium]